MMNFVLVLSQGNTKWRMKREFKHVLSKILPVPTKRTSHLKSLKEKNNSKKPVTYADGHPWDRYVQKCSGV